VTQGKAIADETVAAGAQYIIWSSELSITEITKGKLKDCTLFDYKAEVEQYIRTLPIKSAFYAPASFMQNCHQGMMPRPTGDGTYTLANVWPPTAQIPLIEVAADTGKWIGAILAKPDEYNGKFLAAATRTYTPEEIVQTMSKTSGKTVVYRQFPPEVFIKFLPKHLDVEICEMNQFIGEYGYYGPDQANLVDWAAKQARGKLTTLEEYLEKNPMKLE
jgi:hypothetical protein